MGKVVSGFSMSLDGIIAGPDENFDQLFRWYSTGDTEFTFPGGMVVNISPASAELLRESIQTTGALVVGRRLFEVTHGWGGRHPLDVPVFVVTHTPPPDWPSDGAPFTFVTDGVESAVAQARHVAGEKNVAIASASILQQCLKAGLVDEINIDQVPFVLGAGTPLFAHLDGAPLELECTRMVEAPGVTHLQFRVVKGA